MQREPHDSKTLSIGEFAAATQLTPKALRLYDEQGLLRPAKTTGSGYRVYAVEQVSVGRLIRALRDMSLSLAQIAQVIEAESLQSEMLLREFLIEAEQRYARERRAYQSAVRRRAAWRLSSLSSMPIEIYP
jgi:DNA-binding transcriptional MerR regulator